MNPWTLFRTQGTQIWIVNKSEGELNSETGIRPTSYQFKRERALVGSKNLGFLSYLHIDEAVLVLAKEADLVVIDREAYSTTKKGNLGSLFVYTIDKVKGNEYKLIVDGIPA